MLNLLSRAITRQGCLKTTHWTRKSSSLSSSSSSFNEAVRLVSTSNGLVETSIDGSVATLSLNRPPVNSLSLEMCTDISEAIKGLEAERKVNAVVLKSTNPTILSAGLDFTELYKPNEQRLKTFWNSLQQVYLDLYGSRLAFVAAIEGHAPAGGCMIAMACDYRVMAASSGKHSGTIGLNEATFGLVAPPWMGQLMLRTIGFRKGEEALSLGTLFSPEQALEIGLVDKVVEKDLVLDTSHKIASTFAKIPAQARAASKLLARKQYLDELIKTRDMDTIHFCSFIQNDHVQKGLEAYLEKLKSK